MLLQQAGQDHLVRRQRHVQFGRTGVVWVAPGKDARTAGTTRTTSQECSIESNSLRRQAIDVRGSNMRMPISTKVAATHIVSKDHHKIWTAVDGKRAKGQCGDEQKTNQQDEQRPDRLQDPDSRGEYRYDIEYDARRGVENLPNDRMKTNTYEKLPTVWCFCCNGLRS